MDWIGLLDKFDLPSSLAILVVGYMLLSRTKDISKVANGTSDRLVSSNTLLTSKVEMLGDSIGKLADSIRRVADVSTGNQQRIAVLEDWRVGHERGCPGHGPRGPK